MRKSTVCNFQTLQGHPQTMHATSFLIGPSLSEPVCKRYLDRPRGLSAVLLLYPKVDRSTLGHGMMGTQVLALSRFS